MRSRIPLAAACVTAVASLTWFTAAEPKAELTRWEKVGDGHLPHEGDAARLRARGRRQGVAHRRHAPARRGRRTRREECRGRAAHSPSPRHRGIRRRIPQEGYRGSHAEGVRRMAHAGEGREVLEGFPPAAGLAHRVLRPPRWRRGCRLLRSRTARGSSSARGGSRRSRRRATRATTSRIAAHLPTM